VITNHQRQRQTDGRHAIARQRFTLCIVHRAVKMLLLFRPLIALGDFLRDYIIPSECLSNVSLRFFLIYPNSLPKVYQIVTRFTKGAPPHKALFRSMTHTGLLCIYCTVLKMSATVKFKPESEISKRFVFFDKQKTPETWFPILHYCGRSNSVIAVQSRAERLISLSLKHTYTHAHVFTYSCL